MSRDAEKDALSRLRDEWLSHGRKCGVCGPGLRRALNDLDREQFARTVERRSREAVREDVTRPIPPEGTDHE